ncbi:hypothetical protein RRF57_008131 [Xylaria bambusicola]|uniref:Uncharacterized protein n=1 Tax=Xylaria bambusicola TaxID=326684 RepID=A0AAN7Z6T5_9PEZI
MTWSAENVEFEDTNKEFNTKEDRGEEDAKKPSVYGSIHGESGVCMSGTPITIVILRDILLAYI